MADVTALNLLGKDHFTEAEAAHYACCSPSQFRAKAAGYGILPFEFMGKQVYRKQDIERAMADAWQRSHNAASRGSFPGLTQRRANSRGDPWAR